MEHGSDVSTGDDFPISGISDAGYRELGPRHSLSIESVKRTPWTIQVNIRNRSDAPFKLIERSGAPLTGQPGLIETLRMPPPLSP